MEDALRRASQSATMVRRKTRRTFCTVVKTVYQKIQSLLLIIVLIGYSFLGAFIFNFLEQPHENQMLEIQRNVSTMRRNQSVFDLMSIFENCTAVNDSSLCEEFLANYVDEYEKSVGVYEPFVKYPWDFWNSMLFSVTLFTTIGYGHMQTKTFYGQLATILYATIGIPLLLTFLNDLGKILFVKARRGWNIVRKSVISCVERCRKRSGNSKSVTRMISRTSVATVDVQDVNFPLFLAIGVVFAYIFLCSAIFCFWETEWTYFTAFYFFFISLSTIGLGDIVPDHPRFTLVGFAFFIIGLALVSFCINILQAKVQLAYEGALAKMKNGQAYFDWDDPSAPTSRSTSIRDPYRTTERNLSAVTEQEEPDDGGGASLGVIQIYGAGVGERRSPRFSDDDEDSATPVGILIKPDVRSTPKDSVKFKFDRPRSLKIDKLRPVSWASSVYETPMGGKSPPSNKTTS